MSENQEQDEYEFDIAAEEVAKERWLIVVLPQDNQLQIDIDSDAAYEEFYRRFDSFDFHLTKYGHPTVTAKPSASGLPNQHITLTFKGVVFSESERIALQAALNDDSLRTFLNVKRMAHGVENPTRLFEKP